MSRFSRASLAWLVLAVCPALVVGQKQSKPAAIQQYRAAVALQNQQLFDLAAKEWRTFLKNHDSDPLVAEATHYLGVCHFQQQQYEEAAKAFQQALAAKPSSKLSPAIRLNLGLAHFNLGRAGNLDSYRQAIRPLQDLLDRQPRSEEASTAAFYLAESLVALDQQEAAIQVYQRALKLNRGGAQRERLLYGLAVALQENSDHRQARQQLKHLREEFPTSPLAREATIRQGDMAFTDGQLDEALRVFANLSTNQTDELADYVLARRAACLFELKKYAAAAEAYAAVVQRFPSSDHQAACSLAAGKSYYSAGALAEAKRWLSESVAAATGDQQLEAVHWLAQTELKSGSPKAALEVLTHAIGQIGKEHLTPQLRLDLADAMSEIPDRLAEAAELYASIAVDRHSEDLAPYALYMNAFAQLELKQYASASQAAQQFNRRFAADDLTPDVLAILAECQFQQRDYGAAGKQWQQLCDRYPDRSEYDGWVVRRAVCFERDGAPNSVLDWLRPKIRQLADEPLAEAICLAGNACLQLDQPHDAVSVLRPLVDAAKGPHTDQAMLLLARAEQARGKTRRAQAMYARLAKEFPDSQLAVDAQLQLAELDFAAGNFKAAARKYRELAQHEQHEQVQAAALLGLAWSQQNQNQSSDAVQTLNKLLRDFPQLPEARRARYALSVALQNQEKYGAAIRQLESYLSLDLAPQDRADALLVRGTCQASLQQYDQAITSFRAATKADPDYADSDKVLYELAWAYAASGQEQEATRVFQRLSKRYPRSALAAEAHYRVAEAAYTDEAYDDARRSYRIALASATKRPEIAARAKHKIAWTLYQQQNYQQAETAFREQLGESPEGDLSRAAAWMIGECAYRQGNYRAALSAFRSAAQTSGGDDDLRALGLLHAGQSAAEVEDWQQSLEFHERCLRDHANSEHQHQARYGRAWALQQLNQPKKAQTLYAQVAEDTTSVVGARARFMLGELQFADKDYDAAIRTFFKVAYGYGHPNAPEEYHTWQADSLFEAARCCETTKRLAAAARLYRELVQQHPTSDKVEHAQRKLATLRP